MQTEARERRNGKILSEHSWQPRIHLNDGKHEERRKQIFLNVNRYQRMCCTAVSESKSLALLFNIFLAAVSCRCKRKTICDGFV